MSKFTWTVIGFGLGALLSGVLFEISFDPKAWEERTLKLTETVYLEGCTYGANKYNVDVNSWEDCLQAANDNRKKLEEIFKEVDVLFSK